MVSFLDPPHHPKPTPLKLRVISDTTKYRLIEIGGEVGEYICCWCTKTETNLKSNRFLLIVSICYYYYYYYLKNRCHLKKQETSW